MAKLTGKAALITGAASGIGRETALLFAREGASVVVSDIHDAQGETVAAQINTAGSKAIFVHLDVASEDDWGDAIAAAKSAFGRLDVLVNNAGMVIAGDITQLSLADWRRQQAVNLDGVFLGIKHALPLMRDGGHGGSIVNISSTTAMVGTANLVSYSAAKGGVRALTKSVALQCAAAKDGIRVNSVHPGVINTPIYDAVEGLPLHGDGGANTKHISRDPVALGAMVAPLGIAGEPFDIAAGVLYLASDDARYVTGTELVIDGGLIAR
jgi:NAD(P)-dependent dehydrogenase (short-subunit alcohol dehydrogenase family)